jgi:hypothetical protein
MSLLARSMETGRPVPVSKASPLRAAASRSDLYAPTLQLAEFLAAAYRFEQVRAAPCRARRSGLRWTVEAGALQISFSGHPPVGFGSVPSRPSLVHLTTIIEAGSPGHGGDGPGEA